MTERREKMKTLYLTIFTFVTVLYFVIGVHGRDDEVAALEPVREDNKCGENLFWQLNGGVLTITGTGYMTNYSVSNSPWYTDRLSITSIVIGEGVTSIGNYAFYSCGNLNDVKMPESLELIGQYAFSFCSTITSINISNGVNSIMNDAFLTCANLVNVSLGSNLKFIGNGAFRLCLSLTSFEVEKNNAIFSVTNGILFSDNNTVIVQYPIGKTDTNYTIPDSVQTIGNYAFYLSKLTSVLFSENVTTIGENAFYDCVKLAEVVLPDSIISVGKSAFCGCTGMENLKLSNKLERIGECAFLGCTKLINITLPKSLKHIGNQGISTWSSFMPSIYVEDGNEYFKSVDGVLFNSDLSELIQFPPGKTNNVNYVIPESVKTIGVGAFEYSQLVNVTIPSGVKKLNSCVFRQCEKLTCVTITEGVQSIGYQVFNNCKNLGNVTIPESVNSIDSTAFTECPNLKSVFYQGNAPISQSTAFKSLTSLTNVCTPPGYSSDTFCGATVTPSSEICQTYKSFFRPCTKGSCIDGVVVEVLLDNVTTWEEQTNECVEYHCDTEHGFVSWSNCNSSEDVRRVCVNEQCIEARILEKGKCGPDLYWVLDEEGTVIINGTGYMDNYSSVGGSPWFANKSITRVVIEEGVISIGDYAFCYCSNIVDVEMPDSLELIGQSAFHSSRLTNVKISNGVKLIKTRSFGDCKNLVNVTIGSSLTSIRDSVFEHCTSLTSIEVEKNNTMFSTIDGVLFSDNNTVLVQYPLGKTDVYYSIPDHVKNIGNCALAGSKLTNVIISDNVTTIGNYAFKECKNIINLTLPDSVISIGRGSFFHCDNLENIKLSNSLESIDFEAFYYCTKLANITIPKSVKFIASNAFSVRSSFMASIDVEDGSEYFKSIDGVLFNQNLSELIRYPPGKTNILSYIIPESVKRIKECAFEYSQLLNITIPNGVKMLEGIVFEHSEKLVCVFIPEGVQSIAHRTFYNCTSLGYVTIPESMNKIEDDAFQLCSNLKSVFYQGYTPISSSTALKSLTSLTDVCTPPGYASDTFCGANVTSSSESCKTYQSFFTPCGRGSCVDGVVVEMKWDNVTTWEQQTSECEEYHCDRVHGFVSWRNCNTSDDERHVCVDGKCIVENNVINDGWSVVIDMNNLTVNEVNESDVVDILSNLTGINNLKIGTEVDKKGNVLRIIIYVEDEGMATIVAEAVEKNCYVDNSKRDNDVCVGALRHAVNVQVKCRRVLLSNGYQTMVNLLILFITTMIISM